jgi:hypothetical protein
MGLASGTKHDFAHHRTGPVRRRQQACKVMGGEVGGQFVGMDAGLDIDLGPGAGRP